MQLPVIDLAAGDTAALAMQIDRALCETGFFSITGHGVPPAVQAAAFNASRRFFAQASAEKARLHIRHSSHRRGFDPIGWQSLDPAHPPDVKESFYIGVETIGPNQWPDEARLPGFHAACAAYTAQMMALSRRLLRLFAAALGLPEASFDRYMRNPICTTRLLHYPPQPAQALPGQIGCGAHTDWGALTLLAQDDAGGLQVRIQEPAMSEGTWLDVPPTPDAYVVNVGDMMQRWTNDRWPSTLHRVINRGAHGIASDRYSIAYFCDLDIDASITPLPCCVSPERPARYAPITAGEHLEAMYQRTTVAS